jgi:hypothetical protein
MRGPDRLPVKAVEPGHHAGIIIWSSRDKLQESQSLSRGLGSTVRRGN